VTERVARVRGELERLGIASLLVTDAANVRYLTGLSSSNAAVIVGADKLLLLTDGRYIEAARAVDGVEAVLAERDLPAWLGQGLPRLAEAPVGFEADVLTVAAHESVAASGIALVPTKRVVKGIRAVKEPAELETMRRASRITHDVVTRIAQERLTGRTEAEVAWWVERALRDAGAQAVAFDVIVASGPNAAVPHHRPGPRPIGPGETVIVDLGARLDGYSSDCTRTFATGPLPEALREAYATCRAAQESALAAVRPGASGRDVDAVARAEVAEAGHTVLHGLGHGVGLEIHELPVLSDVSDDVLAVGNVVTVEPGVYVPGLGGVRIEDEVVVTDGPAEILTPFPKDLVELT
jgi:Xaa-Pro aminopeptidase